MLDRSNQPSPNPIETVPFPWPEVHLLKNGLSLCALKLGSQPILELELVFRSGRYYEKHVGEAYFTASMLLEGTSKKDNHAISYLFDYYGAVVTTQSSEDFCSITLSTLSKHLEPALELLEELLLDSIFPNKSLERLKACKCQDIQILEKKNKSVAYQKFCQALFTDKHAYGRFLRLEDVHRLSRDDIVDYYRQQFLASCTAFVAGCVNDRSLELIARFLERLPNRKVLYAKDGLLDEYIVKKISIPSDKQVQSAIVIGKPLLKKQDPDFIPMTIVNTILGGYFGSRLMQNIREDKGYTYGVYSRLVTLQQVGYFMIATQVAYDFTEKTIQEIYKEIDILREKLVSEDELAKVKNYLLGHFLTTINDPFSMMKRFQGAYLYGLGQDYYASFYSHIANIGPTHIRDLARNYLDPHTLTEVVKL